MPVIIESNIYKKADMIHLLAKTILSETIEGVMEIFFRKVIENITLPPHTKYELKILDHPFATRHGTIQEHYHSPAWGIHIEYGQLLEEFGRGIEKSETFIRGWVGWEDSCSKEIKYVIFGTTKMLPRPVLRLTAEQIQIEVEFEKILHTKIEKYIGKAA